LQDTVQHGGDREIFGGACVGAAFVKLFLQVHKRVEALWQDQILQQNTQRQIKGMQVEKYV